VPVLVLFVLPWQAHLTWNLLKYSVKTNGGTGNANGEFRVANDESFSLLFIFQRSKFIISRGGFVPFPAEKHRNK
jgi:hypothetical protein